MKRGLLILATLTATFAAEPVVPRKAPPLGIQMGPEKYTWLSEYSGRTCVVAFILTTCSHCQFTTGVLNRIQKDYTAQGVQIIASAIEPMSSLNIPDFRKKFTPEFPVGYNEQEYAAKFLGYAETDPMIVPQIVIVDKAGMIRAQIGGDAKEMLAETQEKNLRAALDQVLRQGAKTDVRRPSPGRGIAK